LKGLQESRDEEVVDKKRLMGLGGGGGREAMETQQSSDIYLCGTRVKLTQQLKSRHA
jgi:hypothetical protein